MTAAVLEALSSHNDFLTVCDVCRILVGDQYKAIKVNVYVIMQRLIKAGKVAMKAEGYKKKYGIKK
jgi:hypothetical protein